MTMSRNLKVIELEEGWTVVQKGFTKLKNFLDGILEEHINGDEYSMLYTTVYNMCIQMPNNHSEHLYCRYKESFAEYINTTVLPALREKRDEFLLREIVKRWDNHKIMARWLSHIFNHLNRYFVPKNLLPSLNEVSRICFRDLVYAEINNNVKDAAITLIKQEREGGEIDVALMKKVVGVFVEIEVGMEAYESDFELAMLTDTAAYYSRKAASWIEKDSCPDYMLKVEECLKREKERGGHYLHPSSEPKLLEIVQHELLNQYENQLRDKEHSGCLALLRDDKVEDMSRMYRLFCRIPGGLEPVAAIFGQHLTDAGTTLVKQAEDRTNNRVEKDTNGGKEQTFVIKVIELQDKYLHYVNECFQSHLLFHKALKFAFIVFCNKGVAGSTSGELLATFCDNLLKKGGSDRLTDGEGIEDTLEKVVRLLDYISDKDLFAESYRKKLAGRLLFHKNRNEDHEQSIIKKLKQLCGGPFTSKMEAMITDITLARENQSKFEEYLNDNSTSNLEIELTVKVLTTRFWPSYKSSDLALPAEMVKSVQVFKKFYQTKTSNRKLTWIYSLGTCRINGKFDRKPIELMVTTYQAAVLLLFNGADRLSYADIRRQLNLTDEDILRLLHSLSCARHKILNKDPATKTVTPTDFFEFNTTFTDKMKRLRIPLPPLEDKKKVMEDVVKDRRYAIDSSIVRIMKNRKVLPCEQLVLECAEQVSGMFKPDFKIIKKRIEDLVQREFLERDKDDPRNFRYLA